MNILHLLRDLLSQTPTSAACSFGAFASSFRRAAHAHSVRAGYLFREGEESVPSSFERQRHSETELKRSNAKAGKSKKCSPRGALFSNSRFSPCTSSCSSHLSILHTIFLLHKLYPLLHSHHGKIFTERSQSPDESHQRTIRNLPEHHWMRRCALAVPDWNAASATV